MRYAIGALMLTLSAAAWAAGEPVLKLSPKLRAALVAEMAGIKTGMAELTGALATGDWVRASKHALAIRDSYILKQKLTHRELAELEHALPADFQEMDARFHRHAEALAHAAEEKNGELAGFYLGRMVESCVACHTRYATHTLPGFKVAAPAAGHSH
jgi:cytochrome c556